MQSTGTYRPQYSTLVSCKVLEDIVHSNVINHFLHHDILCDNQHGFRTRRSCKVIRICTNKRFQRETTCNLHGHTLEAVDSVKYLGVTISEDLQWKTHIDNITAKASRTVRFLRCNLYNCTKEVHEATYFTLIRPTLENASAVWDPFRTTDINRLEQVQRSSARFVHWNYWDRTPGCVSHMVRELGWPPFVDRRRTHRLSTLY